MKFFAALGCFFAVTDAFSGLTKTVWKRQNLLQAADPEHCSASEGAKSFCNLGRLQNKKHKVHQCLRLQLCGMTQAQPSHFKKDQRNEKKGSNNQRFLCVVENDQFLCLFGTRIHPRDSFGQRLA